MNATTQLAPPPLLVGDSALPPDGTVLVTGSNGFIGVEVVEVLLKNGCRNLRCFVRPTSRLDHLNSVLAKHASGTAVEIVTGNLQSTEDCVRAVRDVSLVYHLAAGFDVSFVAALENSALATRNLLNAFSEHGRPGRFVHVSSFSVYSNLRLKRGALLDEDSPLEDAPAQRADPYVLGKLKQEEAVREIGRRRDLPYVIMRPGAVFGPRKRDLTGRVGLKAGRIFFHVGGNNQLPLTYVVNCAEAIVLAGVCRSVDGETFNIVDDELPSSGEYLAAYRQAADRFICVPMPYRIAYLIFALCEMVARVVPHFPKRFNRRRAAAEWKGNLFSNRKLKERLGWQPRVPMRRALEGYFSQPSGPHER